MTESQHVWIREARKGNELAAYNLYESYSKAMYNTLIRMVSDGELAKDLLQEAFIKALTAKYEDGGVEIAEKEAKKMSKIAMKMMEQADDIRRFRAVRTESHAFFNQAEFAERLKDHLLQTYRMKLTKKQDTNLTELIADRVTGVTNEDSFNENLSRSLSTGGLALDEKEADSLTRYFEKLIAQGVDVSYKA